MVDHIGILKAAGIALAASSLMAASARTAVAAPRAGSAVRRAIRQDNARRRERAQQATETQSAVNDYTTAVANAEAAVVESKAALRTAGQNETATRKTVIAKHEKSLGLVKALADQQAAKTAWESVAGPILEALRNTPEYAQAEAKVTAAKEKRQTGADNDEFVAVPRRGELAAPSSDLMAVAELERRTLDADPDSKALRERYLAAQARVIELHKKVTAAVEDDTTLKSAETATYSARTAVEAAEANLAAAQARLATAQSVAADGGAVEQPRSRRSKSTASESSQTSQN